MHTIVDPPAEWEEQRLFDLFHTRVLGEVLAVKDFEWTNYELVRSTVPTKLQVNIQILSI